MVRFVLHHAVKETHLCSMALQSLMSNLLSMAFPCTPPPCIAPCLHSASTCLVRRNIQQYLSFLVMNSNFSCHPSYPWYARVRLLT